MGSCCCLEGVNQHYLRGGKAAGEQEVAKFASAHGPLAGQVSVASGIRIGKAEERALSLTQLRELRDIIDSGCTVEKWLDPFPVIGGRGNLNFGKPLLREDVNLYHLNYYVILLRSVPKGVNIELREIPGEPCGLGQIITQANNPPPHQGEAVGRIQSISRQGGEVVITIAMMRGCFTPNLQSKLVACNHGDNQIKIDGRDHGHPTHVCPIENCSFMESISTGVQPATVFCSHFWGEPVLHFIQCCEEHARLRGYDADLAMYWVCAYANRQHDLGVDIDPNPDNTSFRRAMRRALGTLLILDQEATPFWRIWCDYEIYTTLSDHGKYLDVVTVYGGEVHALADGLPCEQGDASYLKTRRESRFPIRLLAEGMRRRVEEGQASQEIDKVRILNRMRAHHNLDDTSVLALTDADTACFDTVNHELHAIFAIAAWPQALLKGLISDFDQSGDLSLPTLLKASTKRDGLSLDFTGLHEQISDEHVATLARHCPPHLLDLRLSFWKCPSVTDGGVRAIAENMPRSLVNLKFILFRCVELTNNAIQLISQALPRTLAGLDVDCSWCKQLTDLSLDAIGQHLPLGLRHLRLLFRGCGQVTNFGILALSKCFPERMTTLELDFRMCSEISDTGIEAMSKHLPINLTNLRLSFGRCRQVNGVGLSAIQKRFPQAAIDKTLRLTLGCWQES